MAAGNQNNALLTEHFRYTPLTLLDDIINVVNELVFRAIGALEDGFAARPAQHLGFELSQTQFSTLPNDAAREEALETLKQNEADNGIVQLESLLNATVDRDFDKFEIYALRNILAIGHDEEDLARWVRLDHYRGLDAASVDTAPRPEEVQLQRRKLHETAKLNVVLKADEARNSAILEKLNAFTGLGEPGQRQDGVTAPLSILEAAAKAPQGPNLTQDTQYALDQLPTLQRLLTQLKESMKTTPSSRSHREDTDSIEARRTRYLDSQGLRALERRGIDPVASAGASVAAGRRFGKEDIEGIERVVQTLQTEKQGQQLPQRKADDTKT